MRRSHFNLHKPTRSLRCDQISSGGARSALYWSLLLFAMGLITDSRIAEAQTGDIHPSLFNIQVQNSTTWMQMLSDRMVFSNNSPANSIRCTPSSIYFQSPIITIPATVSSASTSTTQLVSFQEPCIPGAEEGSDGKSKVDSTKGWSIWASGYSLGGNVSGYNTAGGLDYRMGGTMFGIDRRLYDNLFIGAFGGYTSSNVGNRGYGSDASINDYQGGFYELWTFDSIYVSHVTSFSGSTYNVNRPSLLDNQVGPAASSTPGNQFTQYIETGRAFNYGGSLLQPFVGFQYIGLDRSNLVETGAGDTNLTSGMQTAKSLRGSIGVRFAKDFVWNGFVITPTATARYLQEMGDGQPVFTMAYASSPGNTFSTPGTFLGRNFGYFTLGGAIRCSSRVSIYGNAGAQVSPYYSAVTGSGGLQIEW